MLTVYTLPKLGTLPSASPFCVKLETWLRMAGIRYESALGSMKEAPRGKLPYARYNGNIICDSERIKELLSKDYEVQLDHGLSEAQLQHAHLLRRTLEEHLYFAIVYLRWFDDNEFRVLRPVLEEMLPRPAQLVVPKIIRQAVIRQVKHQGTGRRSRDEVIACADRDLDALEFALSDNAYFLGDNPSSVDASAYGMLSALCYGFSGGPLHGRVSAGPLGEFCDRMRNRYWKT